MIKELEIARNKKPDTIYSKEFIIKNNPYSIPFDINSSLIKSRQEAVIYDIADLLKKNKDLKVEIVGLADKNTGSPKFNEILSIKRAKAVENKLIKDYGISPNRIITFGKGDTVQPYPKNQWNRVVIITLVDSN